MREPSGSYLLILVSTSLLPRLSLLLGRKKEGGRERESKEREGQPTASEVGMEGSVRFFIG